MDNPLDFYGGRLTNAERKSNLTEQLLADQGVTHNRKKRYNRLQVGGARGSFVCGGGGGCGLVHQPRHACRCAGESGPSKAACAGRG
jgi:hypothetical protein